MLSRQRHWPTLLLSNERDGICTCTRAFRFQRFLDRIFNVLPVPQSNDSVDDFSIAPDKEALRKRRNSAVGVTHGFFPQQDWIIHPHLFCEAGNLILAGVVHRDADHLQSLLTILFLELDKPGRFDLARAAPGGPEVHHNSLTAQRGKTHALAIERFQREIWSGLSVPGSRDMIRRRFPGHVETEVEHRHRYQGHHDQRQWTAAVRRRRDRRNLRHRRSGWLGSVMAFQLRHRSAALLADWRARRDFCPWSAAIF